MQTLVAFLFVLSPAAFAVADQDQQAKFLETRWLDDRNADHGAHGWPAGYGLSPERYALEAPEGTDAIDPRFQDLGDELGRNFYVAFALYRAGHVRLALNERKHIGKILARFNLLVPPGEDDRVLFRRALARTIADHLTRAVHLAGVDPAEAARLFFVDMEYDAFGEANLRQATKQVRAQWKTATDSAHTWRLGRYLPSEAWAWRWGQFTPFAALTLGAGYVADGLVAEHQELEFTVGSMVAVVVGAVVAKYALPYTRRFRQTKDLVTPALRDCRLLLAPARNPA